MIDQQIKINVFIYLTSWHEPCSVQAKTNSARPPDAGAKGVTMDAHEHGPDEEELTARMFVKLARAEPQKSDRRARIDGRNDFIELEELHNRRKNAGGGRDGGQ
jgi:hypothetical protein